MHRGVVFHDPVWLLVLLALPALWWLQRFRPLTVFCVPFAAAWHRAGAEPTQWRTAWAIAGFALLTLALARPQRREEIREVRQAGYDIMLAIDLSPSMLAEDYRRRGRPIDRVTALRPIIDAFIQRRPNDRIGIVVFSGRAYTLAPLTFQHEWLGRQLDRIRIGMIEEGTALGDGLAVALRRLDQPARQRDGKRDGAFVVLLTDGANNTGLFSPEEATELARERGVRVYTMGIGTTGYVNMPYFTPEGAKVYRRELSDHDDLMLEWIALRTGGRFFRAVRQQTIAESFQAIDAAQRIEFRSTRRVVTAELFGWCAVPGILLLAAAASGRDWLGWRWTRRAAQAAVPGAARTSSP